jgi:D-inositol-3-phosphate glycosyltransferase
MNIALVSEHASPLAVLGGVDAGGQNVHVAALAEGLGGHGHRVTVYTRRDDPRSERRVPFAPGVMVEHVDAGPRRPVPKDDLLPYMGSFAEHLTSAWADDPPDVVHSHFWMSGMASLEAARHGDVPMAHTFHALGVVKRKHQGRKDTSPPSRIKQETRILRSADAIVATCSDEVFELKRLGADGSRIFVVPCGVDLSLFRPDGPVEPRRRGVHRLVVVTRLVERKGVGNVISALRHIAGTELIIAGGPERAHLWEDPEAVRLRRLAQDLGVDERVHFRGRVPRDEVPALIRSADAVVCVPWYEPFGIVPLESMACGVPVVVSAVGGMIDTVVHGRTGIHVPPRRPDLLCGALRHLLSDEQMRKALGAEGVARARSRYGWERIVEATLDVYARIARAGRRGSEAMRS